MNAPLESYYVSPFRRLFALIVDGALMLLALTVLGVALIRFGGIEADSFRVALREPLPLALRWSVALLLVVAATLVVLSLLWSANRGTPGMLLLGQRVVDEQTSGPLDLAHSLLRALAFMLLLIPPLWLLGLWMLLSKKRQGLHDIAARSVVVVEDESVASLDQLVLMADE